MAEIENNFQAVFYVDYVEIDQEERTLFHNNEIDYIHDITEQPIEHSFTTYKDRIQLHYTKPVKEIFVILKKSDAIDAFNFLKFKNMTIKLNNIKIETSDNDIYFKFMQPYYHNRKIANATNVYMYSFALDPDSAQPTGTYMFGDLKSKEIEIELDEEYLQNIGIEIQNISATIFANTVNILKVKDGYGALQFI